MANATLTSLPLFLFLILVSSYIFENKVLANDERTWCVAKPSSTESELQNNINYACQIINCGAIQSGGPCFEPPLLINYASVMMNLFYQQHGRKNFTCYFANSGLIVVTDPSYGSCYYPYY